MSRILVPRNAHAYDGIVFQRFVCSGPFLEAITGDEASPPAGYCRNRGL
jgi:hypothetical protein